VFLSIFESETNEHSGTMRTGEKTDMKKCEFKGHYDNIEDISFWVKITRAHNDRSENR
jgi:hypothetical protein